MRFCLCREARAAAGLRGVVVAAAFTLALLVSNEALAVQRGIAQNWPGRFLIGFRLGDLVQAHVLGYSGGNALTTSLDFAGRVGQTSVASIWIGLGLEVTPVLAGGCRVARCEWQVDVRPGVFAMFTFERRLNVPISPFVRVGVSTVLLLEHIYPMGDAARDYTSVAVVGRVGGGFDYWLTRAFAVGADTYFTIGPGVVSGLWFYGTWDAQVGARCAF